MSNNPFSQYLDSVQRTLRTGKATEHSYRPHLKALIEALATKVEAINEPKRVECGAPDYAVCRREKHGPVTLGYIEAKDIGISLNTELRSDQLKRYLSSLHNLVLTDYLEFKWFVDGEMLMSAHLASVGRQGKLTPDTDGLEQTLLLLSAFLDQEPPPITTPRDLAVRMARLTHMIRDMVHAAFEQNHASPLLRDLKDAFERTLIPDLKTAQFADMLAQTMAYGLFAARCNHQGPAPFRRLGAAREIPRTNPLLRQLFETITGSALDDEPFSVFVDDLVQLFGHADMQAVLSHFGRRGARQDPVLHFYETFLSEYDASVRERRGVYYTPEPVVSYIVRSVDHLLKTRFSCPDGLSSTETVTVRTKVQEESGVGERTESAPRVLILDPACGTGSFLYGVVDHIRQQFAERRQSGMWSGFVRDQLLPRLFGFELLMAPYAVAHLKLGMQLAAQDITDDKRSKWAYDFAGDERLGVYLTNTLEEAARKADWLFGPFRIISDEAHAAARVKRDLPIMVVLGNPPYSGHSANRSWETVGGKKVPTFIGRLLQDYYFVDGKPLGERNPKWLQDDYVKFIRFAQWRIEQTGAGVLAFITNSSYLDNPTFRGMRQQLLNTFTEIYVLDLHGSTKKKEVCPDGSKDQNVFDIQQGVAIGIFVKEPGKEGPARVHHGDLWGLREIKGQGREGRQECLPHQGKYGWLGQNDLSTTEWS
ncbi:MAG TPA: N-6 DNA methylase, partial [Phycisphaerae bacterium]|nr:N-6 DNA methylase [Phycisphaerae bacterium]